MLLAVKSVWQYYVSSSDVLRLLEGFRRMVNGFITDWSGQRCVFAEKAFTPLLQPARPLRFSKLLQALRDIARRRNTRG